MHPDAPADQSPKQQPTASLDFRNINTLWASVIAETLYCLGLRTAVVCPGSRSAPLTVALAQHPKIEAIPVLDERSASFFALGIARRTHQTVAIVCTSGTAGANFYPAVIEARESGVPLLVLTADRPPELRQCHAGQAIDQVKLFGHYPSWQTELALPEAKTQLLSYLRQTIVHAWERSHSPHPGPVHLNIPLRDPLAPFPEAGQPDLSQLITAEFFDVLRPSSPAQRLLAQIPPTSPMTTLEVTHWQRYERGLIIVGLEQPYDAVAYCKAIANLAHHLGWPVLSDALNPLRNFQSLNANLICHYDHILRSPDLETSHPTDSLKPDCVIRLGELPTSKVLRQWLTTLDCPQWVISDRPDNLDPLHGPTHHLRLSIGQLSQSLRDDPSQSTPPSPFLKRWQTRDEQIARTFAQTFAQTTELREPKVAWFLSQHLPAGTPLFIANSTPVRDMEWFWQKGDRQIQPYFNRGANGIDGTLSTALGIAHASSSPPNEARASVMLTGDLALLHDTNGFLLAKTLEANRPTKYQPKQYQLDEHLNRHLTIVLINNNGGGIFEFLPIAQFESTFEPFFATPQSIDFESLCRTYDVEYCCIENWKMLAQKLELLPEAGVRILEIRTDRKADMAWRLQRFASAAPPSRTVKRNEYSEIKDANHYQNPQGETG